MKKALHLDKTLEQVGDLKRGESTKIRCVSPGDSANLPAIIKDHYKHSTLRIGHTQEGNHRFIKVTVIS